ncbi:unnamed protein product (mitochondrion) [Plasmodiophora brassicae]|uniref:Uncharacterized protein n=2 Tax=Plasmodiophora brassicae TaxID=37360 RepID=A0A3P3YMM9_PLABS|nr:unnamed protein product [Plasmodiophora brassicae]
MKLPSTGQSTMGSGSTSHLQRGLLVLFWTTVVGGWIAVSVIAEQVPILGAGAGMLLPTIALLVWNRYNEREDNVGLVAVTMAYARGYILAVLPLLANAACAAAAELLIFIGDPRHDSVRSGAGYNWRIVLDVVFVSGVFPAVFSELHKWTITTLAVRKRPLSSRTQVMLFAVAGSLGFSMAEALLMCLKAHFLPGVLYTLINGRSMIMTFRSVLRVPVHVALGLRSGLMIYRRMEVGKRRIVTVPGIWVQIAVHVAYRILQTMACLNPNVVGSPRVVHQALCSATVLVSSGLAVYTLKCLWQEKRPPSKSTMDFPMQ